MTGWVRLAAGLALTFAPLAVVLLRNRTLRTAQLALYTASGVAISLGVASLIFFLLRFMIVPRHPLFLVADSAILALLTAVALRAPPLPRWSNGPEADPRSAAWAAGSAFAVTIVLAIVVYALLFSRIPHGEWDAWAIWNLRSRFLFRAGTDWMRAFSPALAWSHPDYPLLLPGTIARLWAWRGESAPLVPGLVALLFTCSTVVIVASAVSLLSTPAAGLTAGILLLGSVQMVHQGTAQYADTALGAYAAAAMTFLSLAERSGGRPHAMLAGASAALAAWTKNEGALMLFAFFAAWFMGRRHRPDRPDALRAFACGAAPALVALSWFKLRVAPGSELIAGQGLASTLARLTLSRAWVTLRILGEKIVSLGSGSVLVAIVTVALWGAHARVRARASWRTAWLAMVIGGEALVFVTTPYNVFPYDLRWHLNTATPRLLIQIWPAFLVAVFVDGLSAPAVRGDQAT